MNDVIQRLKASKMEAESSTCSVAAEAGRDWALNRASYTELKRLSDALSAYDDTDLGQALSFFGEGEAVMVIHKNVAKSAIGEIWDAMTGKFDVDGSDSDSVENFVRAAVAVFDEVADSI